MTRGPSSPHTALDQGQAGRSGRDVPTHLWLFQVLLPLLAPLVDAFSVYGPAFLNPVRVGRPGTRQRWQATQRAGVFTEPPTPRALSPWRS